MDGAFFRSFGLSGGRRFGAWCGRLSSPPPPVSPLPHHHLRPAGRGLCLVIFFFRPSPSCGFSLACGSHIFPRPLAWDVRTGGRFAAAGGMAICLLLIVSCRSLACARSFSSCLMFGSSSRASFFFLLAVSGLVRLRWGPSSLCPVSPVPCVSCFVSSASVFRLLPLRLVLSARFVSCLVQPRLVVPRPDCRFACFTRLALVAVLPSCRLYHVPPFATPCLSDGGAITAAVFPFVSVGSLLGGVPRGRSFLDGWSSRLVSVPVFLACLLACPRLGSCVGGVSISCLRVACPQYAYRPVPHIVEAGRYFPFRLFFPVLAYSSMMA